VRAWWKFYSWGLHCMVGFDDMSGSPRYSTLLLCGGIFAAIALASSATREAGLPLSLGVMACLLSYLGL
jgi:hypothetical protein